MTKDEGCSYSLYTKTHSVAANLYNEQRYEKAKTMCPKERKSFFIEPANSK